MGGYAEIDTDRFMFDALNVYVYSRLGWDPHLDIEALLDDWHRNLFGAADNGWQISGDGTLKVINSITVWTYEWSIAAFNGAVYSLNGEASDQKSAKDLTVALGGAGFLIQDLGGWLVDLKFGVLSCDNENDTLVHGVGFGGSISQPWKAHIRFG